MYILSKAGNTLHAPAHTSVALLSAYVAGADVIEITVQTTRDGKMVLCSTDEILSYTGEPGRISEMTLTELYGKDFSQTYQPKNSPNFSYFNKAITGRRLSIEVLEEILRLLPPKLILIIKPDQSDVNAIANLIDAYQIHHRCVFALNDIKQIYDIRKKIPYVKVIIDAAVGGFDKAFDMLKHTRSDGVLLPLEIIVDNSLQLTTNGTALKEYVISQGLTVGAVLVPSANDGCFLREQFEALHTQQWIWAMATNSLLQVDAIVRKQVSMISETFSGNVIDRRKFAFGYAKANKYALVYQDNGVHVEIHPYDGDFSLPTDPLEIRLSSIESKLTFVARDWPYYSGGGLGVLEGLRGDFNAEVEYIVENVSQATTLEMAVVNADPGTHTIGIPRSFRDKDSFYDPHGAPPFVGVEHDEDDGYRINWNYGSEYDNNGYGRPVGDGNNAHGGSLRLQRRGIYFAAYYKNSTDAADWVCVGATRNDSMNDRVFLRCVGKRWRQEDPTNPSIYLPVIPNHFIFKNLNIQLYV